MTLSDFHVLWFALGIAVMLGLEALKKQMQKVPMLLMIQRKLTILMKMQTAQPTLMKTRSLRKIQFTMSQM